MPRLMATSRIVTLTTDFGLVDPYVAAMKGAILSINPQALIVDISHDVRPQAVLHGAFLISLALPYFPTGAIHLAVVDPGVGTARRALALQTPDGTFLGPDNGLLSPALPDHLRAQALPSLSQLPLPQGCRAVALENQRYFRQPVSATFHGRDIFAPVAAHLSLGLALDDLGPALEFIQALPPFQAQAQADGSRRGRVLHIDRFGNLITDVRADDLLADAVVIIDVAEHKIQGLSHTYGQGQGLIAYIGSAGYLEIALVEGSAAAALQADIGLPLIVRPAV